MRRVLLLLEENGLRWETSEMFFTPRRLAVRISGVPEEKPAGLVEVQGPPKRAGFDAAGEPTRTAVGFAAAHGKKPEDLFVRVTAKGEYLFLQKETPAVPVREILRGALAEVILSLPFPKTMRWQEGRLRFSRPVRWLLCLFDQSVIRVELDGLVADNRTFGHRNFTSAPVIVPSPADYERLLFEHRVLVDQQERRKMVTKCCGELAGSVGGELVPDAELVEETVNITEFPEPILCRFHPDYLSLPKAVLVTALKKHQRCFSVQGQDGNLLPYFIAVTNTPGCAVEQVRFWYERAIEARLRDARFFVEADLKQGLLPLVEEERQVVWIEGLGSYYDKTQRLRRLSVYLAGVVKGVDTKALDRAALLCKADLLSNLVREKEFTSLQGVVGGIYARLLGEPEAVATAIAEHYQPRSLDDELPKTVLGGILSIADKVDNIVATYLTGNIPTGSEDPFAVRRQATGMLLIILSQGLPVKIDELVKESLAAFGRADEHVQRLVLELFRERMGGILAEQGIRYDVANAVLNTVWHTPSEAQARARALAEFRNQPEFERLIIGQKRVNNILRGQEVSGLPEPEQFAEEAERWLWAEVQRVQPEVNRALAEGDYRRVLELLLSLRPAIDRLFDDVLIMCPDEVLRINRLRLLSAVRSLFYQVADLSEIVLEGE